MEEDEEVVIKNSGLYSHLISSGYEDFESVEFSKTNIGTQCSNVSEEDNNTEKGNEFVEDYDDYETLVDLILRSSLVFEDDIVLINNFTTIVSLKPRWSGSWKDNRPLLLDLLIKSSAVCTSCWFLSFCGLKTKPYVYYFGIVPVGIYATKRLFCAYRKRDRRNRIEALVAALKSLSAILQKSIHFVQESEILAYNNFYRSRMKFSLVNYCAENDNVKWQVMDQLRKSIFSELRALILFLREEILALIKKYPLKRSVDKYHFYLAFLDEKELQCDGTNEAITVDQLQKMKYVYLLLQSEFLRRLCLCFTPSLWRNVPHLGKLFKSTAKLSDQCAEHHRRINSVFLFYYTFEKCEQSKIQSSKPTTWRYKEAYTKLCSVSFNLQSTLRCSRAIEEFLENSKLDANEQTKVTPSLENMLQELVNNYELCGVVLEDYRKYVQSLRSKEERSKAEEEDMQVPTSNAEAKVTKTSVPVGITDFTHTGPDEVFIAFPTDKEKTEVEPVDFDYSVSKHAYSKLLLNELKLALHDKAQEWKEREKAALKSKNLEEAEVQSSSSSDESANSDDEINRNELPATFGSVLFAPGSSFSEKIALASSRLGLQTEEYFDEDEEQE